MNAVRLSLIVSIICAFASLSSGLVGAHTTDDSPSKERDLDEAIQATFARVSVAHLPTPFDAMERLSAHLGGPRLYIKRDDQTGLAFGGNKARKLDFIFADILAKKTDVVITSAGEQSNWARQTAAAARKFGMHPVLVLSKRSEGRVQRTGNLLLDALMDAEVHLVDSTQSASTIERLTQGFQADGKRVYVAPVGGSRLGGSMTEPLGAVAYADAFRELYRQAEAAGVGITHIVTATGSGSTQAGLVVGAESMSSDVEIIGISTGREKRASKEGVAEIANQTAKALGLTMSFSPAEMIVYDEYIGEGYGVLYDEAVDSIALLAKTEGIMLDPVYTGKAMTGLIDLIDNDHFKDSDVVVFLHTGGTPALFVYQDQLLSRIDASTRN